MPGRSASDPLAASALGYPTSRRDYTHLGYCRHPPSDGIYKGAQGWKRLANPVEPSRQDARQNHETQDQAHQSRPILIQDSVQHNRSFSAPRVCRLRCPRCTRSGWLDRSSIAEKCGAMMKMLRKDLGSRTCATPRPPRPSCAAGAMEDGEASYNRV